MTPGGANYIDYVRAGMKNRWIIRLLRAVNWRSELICLPFCDKAPRILFGRGKLPGVVGAEVVRLLPPNYCGLASVW